MRRLLGSKRPINFHHAEFVAVLAAAAIYIFSFGNFSIHWTSLMTSKIEDEKHVLKSSEGKTVLVTGGAGFIGSHVAEYCATILQMNVVIVDDLSAGLLSNVPRHQSVSFVQGDIKDALFLEDLFHRFEFDYVYHLAAYAAIGLSPFVRSFNYRNNIIGTTELLNFAVKSKVDCFVFTSSNAVYGEGQVQLETTTPAPEDPYGISKYSSELDIRSAHKSFGLDSVILRLHNVYGPNQNFQDKYRNAIGIFMRQVLRGEPITIFGDGKQTRQFTYVSDIAPVIAKAPLVSAARNEMINLGDDRKYTLNKVADKIKHIMGNHNIAIEHVEPRQEVQHATVQRHSKLSRIFGRHDFVPLNEGLALTAKFAQQLLNSLNDTDNSGLREVEIVSGLPRIWGSANLEENAKVNLQRPSRGISDRSSVENRCGPTTVAIMISGQLGRFIFRDNTGPLVAWQKDGTNDRSLSSWWGCGTPVVDVYIALHRGQNMSPSWTGRISSTPYAKDHATIRDIKQYYQQERGARKVFVKFVDDDHMLAFDADMMNQVSTRRLPGNFFGLVKNHTERRFRPYTRMFYLRHLAYAMALEQQRTYSIYVSQREDALFYKPLNFTHMGFVDSISSSGERITSKWKANSRDAHAYVFVEKWCKFGSYSDKIHIGNKVAMSTLFGQNWQAFLHLMLRYSSFGYAKGGDDPYQTEAFLQDLLNNATVKEVDLSRVDVRYVDGKRCVTQLYYTCQPQWAKYALSNLSISEC